MARTAAPAGDYDDYRDRQADISRRRSESGRDIGPLPKVQNKRRRERCRADLELFATTYFPARFPLPFASFHRAAIGNLQWCTHGGGLFVCALPRGSGKDTLAEVEVLRALLYGHRQFVVLIAATQRHAERSLKKIKAELETNELLLADFPEACYPVRRLERINNRAGGQTIDGEPTRMEWTSDVLVLPTVKGSACSGSVVQVAGLTGAIRGLTVLGPDGQPMRPDMVIINDAQDRESAKSPTQTADREAVISDDVLMLAGPTVTIAATILCTVIYRNDLSDRFLSAEKHPEWQSVRTKMLDSFPADMTLWDEYAELRRGGLRDGDGGSAANEFYAANRAAMDVGGVPSWPERKKAEELTGLQSAMNIFIDNRRGFFAEMQNDPEADAVAAGTKELDASVLAGRLSGVERYMVPAECTRLVAFIDCGLFLHWYAVVAFTEGFGGSVVDYGCWPRQQRAFFAADDARPKLADAYPGLSPAQLVFRGLEDLSREVIGRTYYRQGGGEETVRQCLVDSGYETKAVYQWVRQSAYSGILYPSKGRAETTTASGIATWKRRPGERVGYHWRVTAGEESRVKAVVFDPDRWKSFLFGALTTPPGGMTGFTLFGKEAGRHEMIAHHLAAEYSSPVTIRGVTFDKWQIRPDRPDNHLLDCIVGACVAYSVQSDKGPSASGTPAPVKEPPKPLTYSSARAAPQQPAATGGKVPLTYAAARQKAGTR